MNNSKIDTKNILPGIIGVPKILGVSLVILGFTAIIFPYVASISVEVFAGWLLLVGGTLHIIHTIRSKAHSGRIWLFMAGFLQVAVGVALLVYPLSGMIVLTVILAMAFIAEGTFRAISALCLRPKSGWFLTFFSGFLSIVIGILLYMQLPSSALWAIGLLIGINIMMAGLALLTPTSSRRRQRAEQGN